MNMNTLKKEFETMRTFKKQVDALNFIIGIWRQEIEDVVLSPDFSELTREELEELIIPNAMAIRYWTTQLDDFMDRNMASWRNRGSKSKSAMMKMTLEEAIEEYSYIPTGMDKVKVPEKSEKPVKPVKPVKDENEVESEPSEDDRLLQSMINGS